MNVYTPEGRIGWWGGLDKRPRCTDDDKVVFPSEERAERAAEKIRARMVHSNDNKMTAYLGGCGNWHVGHAR